jgi:hypothetical protein
VTDVDGNSEDRSDTVSVFNGPPPAIRVLKSEREEIKTVGGWLAERATAGVLPHEVGLFVRSAAQLDRAKAAAREAGMPFKILDDHVELPRMLRVFDSAASKGNSRCSWRFRWPSP